MSEYYPLIIAAGQVVASLGLLATAVLVFYWSRRRDKNELNNQLWGQAQTVNLTLFTDPVKAEILERAIYEQNSFSDEEQLTVDVFLFLYLNRILMSFSGYKRNIISYKTYIDQTSGTLKLICAQSHRVRYLLLERGYPQDFAFEILDRLRSREVSPPVRQDATTIASLEEKLQAFTHKRPNVP